MQNDIHVYQEELKSETSATTAGQNKSEEMIKDTSNELVENIITVVQQQASEEMNT
jgi:hypothetical protein